MVSPIGHLEYTFYLVKTKPLVILVQFSWVIIVELALQQTGNGDREWRVEKYLQ